MALAYTILFRGQGRNYKEHVVKIVADGSYSSGGYTLDAASCGLQQIDDAEVTQYTSPGLVWFIDQETGKMNAQKGNGVAQFVECAGGDVSTADIMRVKVRQYTSHAGLA